MIRVWGIHMPEWVGDDPVERSYICIGWPRLGDILKLRETREGFKDALARAYPGKKAGAIPMDAGTLYRFAHEIKPGDLVVYPSKHNRMINIGRATDRRWYEPDPQKSEDDLPNCLGVDWQGQFARTDFSQSALYEIGTFINLFLIRKHANKFLTKIGVTGASLPFEDEDEATILDDVVSRTASQVAEESTEDFIIRRLNYDLSGSEFEHFVAQLVKSMGYTTHISQKSGDGEVDVIAHSYQLGFQPLIIKIQCKRQTSPICEPEVSHLLGTLLEGENALFVTLGSYTELARIRGRNNPRLRLLDGQELVEIILAQYPKMSARNRRILPLKQIYVLDSAVEYL